MPIETVQFAQERERRQLRAELVEVEGLPVLVDDLAVSGTTLAVATSYVAPEAQTAGVGMLYDSRTTRRSIGIQDIRSGLVYAREQGGRPPVNSLDSLRAFPDRCEALAERYFAEDQAAFCELIANPEATDG